MTDRSVATQLSFALYSAANRMVRLHKPILEPLGLTFSQYLVILELLDGGPRSVGSLGAALDMDTGTITPLVKRLEAAGRLTRTRDPEDERRVVVDLTPGGRSLDVSVRRVTEQIQSACQLTDDDLDDLRRTLGALAQPSGKQA
jgi:MarR family transcriptional regulator, organic hydroperoxide resistance regulator